MADFEPPPILGMRGVLVKVGLGTPPARAFVTGAVVGLAAYAVKWPHVSFDEKGQMRPMAVVSKDPTATPYHFLAVPVAAATIAYLFT